MTPPRTSPGASATTSEARARGDIESAVLRIFAPHLAKPGGRRLWLFWKRTLRLLRPLGGVSQGNAIRVFGDGDKLFEELFEALGRARKRVLVNTYLLEPDRIGLRVRDELVGAAVRGCEVTLLYDSVGSSAVNDGFLDPMVAEGVKVVEFNPVLRFGTRLSRLVRNHRKIFVVDDEAFCGGMNVSEDYAGPRLGNGRFRDVHLLVRGPAVRDLVALVQQSVEESTGETPRTPRPKSPKPDEPGGSIVQVLESNIRRQRHAIQKALRYTVIRSVERCYLTSPYLVPPKRLMRDLQHAARRRVDVRVLTAGRSDVPLVHLASQHLYGRLLRAGVRIFEMEDAILHAKTATIDGVYASVGSFNLDYWSYRRNLEVNVTTLDRSVAAELEARFRTDLEASREVHLTTWQKRTFWQRAMHWLAYQVMRF